jgi:hypothetical protein
LPGDCEVALQRPLSYWFSQKMGISPGYWETPLTNALKLRAVQTHYFFGVTRPFLQASVNSSLESLPSLLVSAELKFLTAD